MTNAVSQNVDSWCTRCKMMLAHTIEALVATKISRVHCNTCGSQHAYRAAPPGTRSTGSKPRSARAKPAAVAEITNDYEILMRGRDSSAARPYAPGDMFEDADLIRHPTFGLGVVIGRRAEKKVQVAFSDKVRTLVHAG